MEDKRPNSLHELTLVWVTRLRGGWAALLLHARAVRTGNPDFDFLVFLLAVTCSVSGCSTEYKMR